MPRTTPSDSPDRDVTPSLRGWQGGDAVDRLLPLVYDELHRIADGAMRRERSRHTLQTTAARAMRRVLVDHARARKRATRGGGEAVLALDSIAEVVAAQSRADDVLALNDALERLFALDERKGRIVELCHFGGLTYEEIARTLDVSPATVHRDLRMGRAWLYNELRDDEGP